MSADTACPRCGRTVGHRDGCDWVDETGSPMSNDREQAAALCPMPDEVCADCGYRCVEATPDELADAGRWGRAILEKVTGET